MVLLNVNPYLMPLHNIGGGEMCVFRQPVQICKSLEKIENMFLKTNI